MPPGEERSARHRYQLLKSPTPECTCHWLQGRQGPVRFQLGPQLPGQNWSSGKKGDVETGLASCVLLNVMLGNSNYLSGTNRPFQHLSHPSTPQLQPGTQPCLSSECPMEQDLGTIWRRPRAAWMPPFLLVGEWRHVRWQVRRQMVSEWGGSL